MNGITVCLATIPPRADLLARALASVTAQTLQPDAVIVEYDHDREGAAATKNRAWRKASTEWVAMLDDDDDFLPHHLQALHDFARGQDADLVYSIPRVPERTDQTSGGATRDRLPFDPDLLERQSYIQSTVLVRRALLEAGGGFWCPPGSHYDDWGMALGVLRAGGRIVHCPEVTFNWHHHGHNTSGLSNRW